MVSAELKLRSICVRSGKYHLLEFFEAKKCVEKGGLKGRTQLLKQVEGLRMNSWMLQLVAKDLVQSKGSEQNMCGEQVARQLAVFIFKKS